MEKRECNRVVTWQSHGRIGFCVVVALVASVTPAAANGGLIVIAVPPFVLIPLAIVIAVEALILRFISHGPTVWRASFAANLLSYAVGLVVLFGGTTIFGGFWYTLPVMDFPSVGVSWVPGIMLTFGLTYIVEYAYLRWLWRKCVSSTRVMLGVLTANIVSYIPIAYYAHKGYWNAVDRFNFLH